MLFFIDHFWFNYVRTSSAKAYPTEPSYGCNMFLSHFSILPPNSDFKPSLPAWCSYIESSDTNALTAVFYQKHIS